MKRPNLRLPSRKSRLQRLVDTVTSSLDVPRATKFGRPGSGHGLKTALPQDTARRAGLIAGGLAGLTATSAGLSSLRRRQEGARADS